MADEYRSSSYPPTRPDHFNSVKSSLAMRSRLKARTVPRSSLRGAPPYDAAEANQI
jgi:hypothetical protein